MQTPSHLELALLPSSSCVDNFAEHVFFYNDTCNIIQVYNT